MLYKTQKNHGSTKVKWVGLVPHISTHKNIYTALRKFEHVWIELFAAKDSAPLGNLLWSKQACLQFHFCTRIAKKSGSKREIWRVSTSLTRRQDSVNCLSLYCTSRLGSQIVVWNLNRCRICSGHKLLIMFSSSAVQTAQAWQLYFGKSDGLFCLFQIAISVVFDIKIRSKVMSQQ